MAERETRPPRIHVWAIIGEGDSGKSTSIGYLASLLGRGRADMRYIMLRGGGYQLVHVRKQSVQEANRSPDEVISETEARARKLQRDERIGNIGRFNILLALRSDRINGQPLADEYLSRFVNRGWEIESIVLMDYQGSLHSKYYSFGVPTCELYDSKKMVRKQVEHAWMVGQIRNHFGWA